MGKLKTKPLTIGQQIREARESQSISQADLAAAIAITQSAVSQIESGLVFPAFSTLDSICQFLELRLSLAPNSAKKANSRRNS